MPKRKSLLLFSVFISSVVLALSCCSFNFGSMNKKSLEISNMPAKTAYIVGEEFSTDGLVVKDKETKEEIKDYKTLPEVGYVFENKDIGNVVIEISKDNYKNISFTVTVDSVSSIQLKERINEAIANLDDYFDNIDFLDYDSSGIQELTDIYNEGKKDIRSAKTVEEVENIYSSVIERLEAVTKKTSEAHIVSIEIVNLPTKTTYLTDEEIDLTGLILKINYSDGTSVTTQTYTYDEVDMSIAGTKDVIIRYREFSTSFSINVVKKTGGIKTLDIYATNDIHGQVEGQYNRASIDTLMTYLKDKRDNENTLLLDQGDTWQGSIYSNYNHGAMITDLMNYVRYDARTVGNHDFDWGIPYLVENTARSYEGYSTPVLAANIYDYDLPTNTVGNVQQSDIGVKTVTYTLENGLKVGIVGCIGKDQITTISSIYTKDIAFIDHIPVIKEEATRLRNEGCDIVISSNHSDQEDLMGYGLGDYVDLVLCGHSHQREEMTESGLYFAQYGAYNQYVGHITLEYNSDTGELSYKKKEAISASSIKNGVSKLDPTIEGIVATYNSECDEVASEVVASNVSGSFYSTEEMPNLMCRAIYDQAVEEGYEIDLAFCNQGRASLYDSSWTYADLYQVFPFDNIIYIIDVSFNEMVSEVGAYNFLYRSPNFDGTVVYGKTYRIACIDFLAFHTNTNRNYDYFPENKGQYVGMLKDNYRVILRNWLINNHYDEGVLISSNDYSSSLTSFSRQFTYM